MDRCPRCYGGKIVGGWSGIEPCPACFPRPASVGNTFDCSISAYLLTAAAAGLDLKRFALHKRGDGLYEASFMLTGSQARVHVSRSPVNALLVVLGAIDVLEANRLDNGHG